MTILDYLKHSVMYDNARAQRCYALMLLLMFNGVMAVLLTWPLYEKHQALKTIWQATLHQTQLDAMILKQQAQLASRYQAQKQKLHDNPPCEWVRDKEADAIDVPFEKAKPCLLSWIEDHDHKITEISMYKKGKVRALEVMHD